MLSFLRRLVRRAAILVFIVFAVAFVWRGWDMRRGLPLEVWHTTELGELDAAEIDRADWAHYLRAEEALFARVEREIAAAIEPEERTHYNRFSSTSSVFPGHFATNWNRSSVLMPEGEPVGVAVLLHGLTDSPYSLRHVGKLYRERGFAVVSIRIPGHGTVPGAMKVTRLDQWRAAARLAVREARRLAGDAVPLHIVGYSNGGALALDYTIEAISGEAISGEAMSGDVLARPDRLVLLSPMVAITPAARFTWLAGLPAIVPIFAQSAWLSILPEFNPFKYNSLPVHAGQQSFDMTQRLQAGLRRLAETGGLERLPPILTFQSVFDFTVSTHAILTDLYARLPANGSELVLFDPNLNVNNRFGAQIDHAAREAVFAAMPAAPRRFRSLLVTNRTDRSDEVIARVTEAGATASADVATDLAYPAGVYSLSHVAIPFPLTDGLYGLTPDPLDDFGIRTGMVNTLGEVGTFVLTIDPILRMTSRMQSNPFFPLMLQRIEAGILAPRG